MAGTIDRPTLNERVQDQATDLYNFVFNMLDAERGGMAAGAVATIAQKAFLAAYLLEDRSNMRAIDGFQKVLQDVIDTDGRC